MPQAKPFAVTRSEGVLTVHAASQHPFSGAEDFLAWLDGTTVAGYRVDVRCGAQLLLRLSLRYNQMRVRALVVLPWTLELALKVGSLDLRRVEVPACDGADPDRETILQRFPWPDSIEHVAVREPYRPSMHALVYAARNLHLRRYRGYLPLLGSGALRVGHWVPVGGAIQDTVPPDVHVDSVDVTGCWDPRPVWAALERMRTTKVTCLASQFEALTEPPPPCVAFVILRDFGAWYARAVYRAGVLVAAEGVLPRPGFRYDVVEYVVGYRLAFERTAKPAALTAHEAHLLAGLPARRLVVQVRGFPPAAAEAQVQIGEAKAETIEITHGPVCRELARADALLSARTEQPLQ